MESLHRRVVVTGMGAITPAGMSQTTLFDALMAQRVCIGPLTRLDPEHFGVYVAGEVPDFHPEDHLDRRAIRRMDRYSQFAMIAAEEAVKQSGIDWMSEDTARCGVIVGSGIGGMETIEREHEKMIVSGTTRVTPLLVPMIIGNMGAGNIAIHYGLRGPCTAVVTACASGTHCIGDAFHMIQRGMADVMLAGGAEAPITKLALAGFVQLNAMTTSRDPLRASIPFDAQRDGFVIGEGAGIVVLESLEHALARDAHILAEVVGYGSTGDGYHMTAPQPEGDGAIRSMLEAMREGGIQPQEVGYINAHGTGTSANDAMETHAIHVALGEAAQDVAISSTKSSIGHLLGAAGGVEAIICIHALQTGVLPATLGYREADPACDLDIIPNRVRKKQVDVALSNSFGFGGHNATLALRRYQVT